MWRDPLDELIERLEHALPPPPQRYRPSGPPLEDLQWAVTLFLYARTAEERETAERVRKEIFEPGYRSRFR
jgi:hypothetical protein